MLSENTDVLLEFKVLIMNIPLVWLCGCTLSYNPSHILTVLTHTLRNGPHSLHLVNVYSFLLASLSSLRVHL